MKYYHNENLSDKISITRLKTNLNLHEDQKKQLKKVFLIQKSKSS